MKKIASVLLATVFVALSMGMTAFADETQETTVAPVETTLQTETTTEGDENEGVAPESVEDEDVNAESDEITIALNTEVFGAITKTSEEDWYKFTLPADGKVEFVFNHPYFADSSSYWKMALYRTDELKGIYSNKTKNGDVWAFAGTEKTTKFTMGLAAGTYHIKVYRGYFWNDSDYSFQVNFTQSKAWEKEYNRTADTATVISKNMTYYGNVCQSDDEDWFKFTVEENGEVEFVFTHPYFSNSSSYWKMALYRTNEIKGIYTNKTSGGDVWEFKGTEKETKFTMGLAAGTYYAKVYKGYYADTSTYSLRLNYTKSSVWEKEYNGNAVNANTISTNTTYYGNICHNDDEDWYKFSVPADGKVEFVFTHPYIESSNSYWKMAMYRTDELQGIYTNQTSGGDHWQIKGSNKETKFSMGLKSGTYYIRVFKGYSSSASTYTLRLNYTKSTVWEKEYNGDFGSARTIAMNTSYYGSICQSDDVDYYKFTVSGATDGKITFTHPLNNNNTTAFWYLTIYKSDGNTQTEYAKKIEIRGNENLEKKLFLDKGTYYLRITKGYSTDQSTYKFMISDPPLAPSSVKATSQSLSSIKVTWNAVDGANGYQIWRSESADGEFKNIASLTDISKVNGSLTPGNTYYYKVRAYKTKGSVKIYGDFSSVVSAKATLQAPSSVSAKVSSPTTVDIKWSASSETEFVQVWRTDKANAAQSDYVLLGTYKATDKASVSRFLFPNKTYYYKLRGYTHYKDGKTYYSSYSKVVSAKPSVTIGTPTGLKVTGTTKDSVSLVWDKVSGSNIMYEVWRLESRTNTPGVCLGRYSDPSKVSTNLTAGKTYYYRVRAYYYYYDGDGVVHRVYGDYSSIVAGTTKK